MLSSTSEAQDARAQAGSVLRVVVHSVHNASSGVRALMLRPESGTSLPAWEPGSHIDVYVPGVGPRQYSLCGDPRVRDEWTIAVQLEADGRGGSSWMHRAEPGLVLEVGVPRNQFPLVDADSYYFIAGGIGITPLLAMVRTLPEHKPWKLLYGGRSLSSMAFAEDLRTYADDRVVLHPQDTHGLLDIAQFTALLEAGDAVYACGPPAMLRAVEEQSENWPRGVLHIERFAPQEQPASQSGSFEVVLARSNKSVRVESEETIVQALSRIGVSVTTVCQEGVCGTCETAVLQGIPEHRDSVLSEEERLESQTMMLCCSRAVSERLILDL
ncbi:oxidoreductase [Amycolatopsis acidicola]|uniref:Oxidoreductase n=2 Tax=Amycolatopsis acidicola TaxID=2596893 RepID=A0A5N0VG11_9PSEU|nr:oxidoreductase [Amycolatopsis acidicola]